MHRHMHAHMHTAGPELKVLIVLHFVVCIGTHVCTYTDTYTRAHKRTHAHTFCRIEGLMWYRLALYIGMHGHRGTLTHIQHHTHASNCATFLQYAHIYTCAHRHRHRHRHRRRQKTDMHANTHTHTHTHTPVPELKVLIVLRVCDIHGDHQFREVHHPC